MREWPPKFFIPFHFLVFSASDIHLWKTSSFTFSSSIVRVYLRLQRSLLCQSRSKRAKLWAMYFKMFPACMEAGNFKNVKHLLGKVRPDCQCDQYRNSNYKKLEMLGKSKKVWAQLTLPQYAVLHRWDRQWADEWQKLSCNKKLEQS